MLYIISLAVYKTKRDVKDEVRPTEEIEADSRRTLNYNFLPSLTPLC